jgi:hypothetical protein
MKWKDCNTKSNRFERESLEDKELRLSLDPELELLCMLSPLQVIYALKVQTKSCLNFKVDKFNKGGQVMTSFKMTWD